jgi:GntR family transcriptional regulator
METRIVSIGPADDVPDRYQTLLHADRLLLRNRIYVVDGRRVMWARSYLPADAVAGTAIEKHDTGPGGTFARLAEIGLAMALFAEEVEVRRPLPEEQKHLKISADEPVARIVRMNATAEERIVEITDMVAVGEAYRFRWTFTS